MTAVMMKLIEEVSGVGDLSAAGDLIRRVQYQITRYQGMHDVSGMPIPGVHRIEGSVDTGDSFDFAPFVGVSLVLRLEDVPSDVRARNGPGAAGPRSARRSGASLS